MASTAASRYVRPKDSMQVAFRKAKHNLTVAVPMRRALKREPSITRAPIFPNASQPSKASARDDRAASFTGDHARDARFGYTVSIGRFWYVPTL